MKVLTRSSIAGNEYWDTEEKKSIFVPKGMNPDFEVTENPKSMIIPEEKKVSPVFDEFKVGGQIEINGEPVFPGDKNEDVSSKENNDSPILEEMNIKELRAYAKKKDIDIPSAIKTKGDILQIIEEAQ